jgi:putative hydrolase of the HAD superfamily
VCELPCRLARPSLIVVAGCRIREAVLVGGGFRVGDVPGSCSGDRRYRPGTSRHCIGGHPCLAFEVSFGCIPRDDEPGSEIAGVGGIESGGDLDWAKTASEPDSASAVHQKRFGTGQRSTADGSTADSTAVASIRGAGTVGPSATDEPDTNGTADATPSGDAWAIGAEAERRANGTDPSTAEGTGARGGTRSGHRGRGTSVGSWWAHAYERSMTIRAVGFDLDYTLAVPERDRQTLMDEASAAVEAPQFSREAYLAAHGEHLTGRSRAPVFDQLLTEAGATTDVDSTALAEAYRERVSGALRPVPGAESLVADLRGRYRVGLLTNGPTLAQRDKITTLGWEDAFDAALVTGDLPAGKPDPSAFRALVDTLDVAPEETVYIGDDVEADIAGAARAGLHPVQVTFPGSASRDPRAVAHVDRDRLVEELPGVVAGL